MRIAAALIAVSALAAAQETPKPHESRIRRVTVYPDRALVVREAALQVPAGSSLIEIRDLPAGVLPDTVRARIAGPEGVRLRGLEVKTYAVEKAVGARARELGAARETLTEAMKAVEDRLAALASRREFVLSIKAAAGHEASSTLLKEKLRIDDLKGAAAFVEEALLDVAAKTRLADKEKRDLEGRRRVLDAELAGLSGGEPLTRRAVAVALEAPQAAAATLEVSYVIVGAGWVPFYDVHASLDRSEATIHYYGQILQSTGEDWSQVELALSTAHPARSTKMPEMAALAVSSAPSKAAMQGQMADNNGLQRRWQALDQIIRSQNDAVYNRKDYHALELPPECLQSQIASHVFRIKTPETVPSDGSPHKVTIATTVFRCEAARVATPKLSPHLYLKTQVRNTNGFPYMPGDLNIFLGNDYIGSGAIELIAPNEAFEVFLGVDEGIKVTRRLESRRTEAGTLQKTHYVFVIRVENFKAQPAQVSVLDQLPVSRDSNIEIIPDPDMTKPNASTQDGRLTWVLEIAPGQAKEIRLAYRVYHPAGQPVFGLE
jgi:uncharacterized protein (TIGR02231 family)